MTFARWSLRVLGVAVTREGFWWNGANGSTHLEPHPRRAYLFLLGLVIGWRLGLYLLR